LLQTNVDKTQNSIEEAQQKLGSTKTNLEKFQEESTHTNDKIKQLNEDKPAPREINSASRTKNFD
jgi:peptidoglycan hydrolase CwlO-like protein